MSASASTPASKKKKQSTAARAKDVLARMTLEEKLAQLTSRWFIELQVDQNPAEEKMKALLGEGIGEITRVGGSSTHSPVQAARAGNAIQRFLVEHTRLGIPAILHEECCAGYMGLGGTIFPQMIGLASTWNPELAGRMTDEIRRQMVAVGARQGLGPVLDVASDPRWGRTEETFGEDPYLVSRFGVAYIRGLQGADPASGVMATGKHFVGHSLPEGGFNCAPMHLGMRTLRETYLLPFEAAIREAGLLTVMHTYNELDGEPPAVSRTLLQDILRGELGFDGLVVSDYNAVHMLHTFHRTAPDLPTAAVQALSAGIELELPTAICYAAPLRAALESGALSLELIDAAVRRILEAKDILGLFDHPYADENSVEAVFETKEQRALAGEIARQSIILLKNNGILPLAEPRSVAVIGPNAGDPRNLAGDYSYAAVLELVSSAPMPGSAFMDGYDVQQVAKHSVQIPTVVEALRSQFADRVNLSYAPGCPVLEADRSGIAEAVRIASEADVVILVLGDKSGLVLSCTSGETRDRADLGLPGIQQELAEAVVAAGKPVIAVLINGRPLALPWLEEHAAAIVEAWLPGEEGAAAIIDVLLGKSNPGGRLPISVPRTVGQVPVTYRHKPTGGRSNWHGDYVECPAAPLYPFGYGLSYTTFEYSGLEISPRAAAAGGTVDICVQVANTGSRAGDEVVQLYLCDEFGSIPRPVKELKGFQRISLQPGESRRITFHLPVDHLAFFDEKMQLVVEPGTIRVMVGGSSEDIRLTGSFDISGVGKSPVAKRVLHCPVSIQ